MRGCRYVALVFVLLTVLSAVALSILASRRSGGGDTNGDHFGRAPYTTAVFSANSSFIQDLSKVLDQLKDAARQEDWVLDWAKVNTLTSKAEEAAKKSDYVAAVRDYCRSISVFMEQLRHQRCREVSQIAFTGTALRTNSGSIVTPKPGPEGTRTMPFSHFRLDVSQWNGIVPSPLNS